MINFKYITFSHEKKEVCCSCKVCKSRKSFGELEMKSISQCTTYMHNCLYTNTFKPLHFFKGAKYTFVITSHPNHPQYKKRVQLKNHSTLSIHSFTSFTLPKQPHSDHIYSLIATFQEWGEGCFSVVYRRSKGIIHLKWNDDGFLFYIYFIYTLVVYSE